VASDSPSTAVAVATSSSSYNKSSPMNPDHRPVIFI
jgi:hypothetical protein